MTSKEFAMYRCIAAILLVAAPLAAVPLETLRGMHIRNNYPEAATVEVKRLSNRDAPCDPETQTTTQTVSPGGIVELACEGGQAQVVYCVRHSTEIRARTAWLKLECPAQGNTAFLELNLGGR
jgi:hypothetical protein